MTAASIATVADLNPARIRELRRLIEERHTEIQSQPAPIGQVPLHIACLSSDCRNGLHCLNYVRGGRAGRAPSTGTAPGQCTACGEVVVALPAVRACNLRDTAELFDQQRRELIREHYWTVPMDMWVYNQAYRLGRDLLHRKVEKVLREKIGEAMHPREGRQTSWHRQDAVAYAQHAVAACCRECVAYWHGVERGRPLDEAELAYLARLAKAFLDLRLPDLPEYPSRMPAIPLHEVTSGEDPFDLRARLTALLETGVTPAGLLVPYDHFKELKTELVHTKGDQGGIRMRSGTQQMSTFHLATAQGQS